jgi:hypothetical protein
MNKETVNRLVASRKNTRLRKLNENISWGWAHIHRRIPEQIMKNANNNLEGAMGEYMAEVEMLIAEFLTLGRRMNYSEEEKQYVADTIRWRAWQMLKGAQRGARRRRTRRRLSR